MTRIVYAPESLDDVQAILAYLKERDSELVEKFEADYRKALERIRNYPQAWPKVSGSVRVKIVSKRFPYGIYYEHSKNTVFLAAVIHVARRPARWRRRFRK
ncbi:MAG TPA: type II toxin-antitoxin system RelE/ParE family toxin [Gemmataceae bacterium]|jgi:plasmid stabilization system protein ParE|nr:type II toxin-antitoxin system RelE/ParE family toxin [Gemmataceae bacterium]